jgi:two-component system nitrate/nitrite response regulator NarL
LQNTRYKVVASIASPEELSPDSCPKGQPKLAIVGINLQNGNLDQAAESIRLLRSSMPDGKVVLVAETNESVDLQRVLALSPDACIFSLASRDTLIKVLELTLMDQRVFVFAKSVVTAFKHDLEFTDSPQRVQPSGSHEFGNGHSLSPRESEVLTSLAQGKSNKLIARVCHISEATVKVHLKAILRKTKAQNRTQAAIWAIGHGFRGPFSESDGLSVQGNGHSVESNGHSVQGNGHSVQGNGHSVQGNGHSVQGNGRSVGKDGLGIAEPPALSPVGRPVTIASAPAPQVQTALAPRSAVLISKQRQQTR